eukprot:m.297962 g.297962  ORF g.297962 m.297962 type:complete len:159 (+) comp16290_c0_seq1:255-731(+)
MARSTTKRGSSSTSKPAPRKGRKASKNVGAVTTPKVAKGKGRAGKAAATPKKAASRRAKAVAVVEADEPEGGGGNAEETLQWEHYEQGGWHEFGPIATQWLHDAVAEESGVLEAEAVGSHKKAASQRRVRAASRGGGQLLFFLVKASVLKKVKSMDKS